MDKIQCRNELEELRNLIQKVMEELASAPEGSLWVHIKRKRFPQYYRCFSKASGQEVTPRRHYLTSKENELVRKLAQKEYDQKLLTYMKKQERCLSVFLQQYEEDWHQMALKSISEHKRKLIRPHFLSNEAYIEAWYKRYCGPTNPYPIENGYQTERGEFVRSKSEMIFLDKLFHADVPYIYEPALTIKGGRTIFPDVMVLNVKSRKHYYIELLGMMDTPEYSNRAVEKIKVYGENNIYLWDQLLILMETSKVGIDTRQMDHLIRCILT